MRENRIDSLIYLVFFHEVHVFSRKNMPQKLSLSYFHFFFLFRLACYFEDTHTQKKWKSKFKRSNIRRQLGWKMKNAKCKSRIYFMNWICYRQKVGIFFLRKKVINSFSSMCSIFSVCDFILNIFRILKEKIIIMDFFIHCQMDLSLTIMRWYLAETKGEDS